MKIFLAQQNYHIGNFEQNTRQIIEAVEAARSAGADLVVFSELSVCGYPPRDFLEFDDFTPGRKGKIYLTQHSYCMKGGCRQWSTKPCFLLTMFLMKTVISSRLMNGILYPFGESGLH